MEAIQEGCTPAVHQNKCEDWRAQAWGLWEDGGDRVKMTVRTDRASARGMAREAGQDDDWRGT